MRSHNLYDGAWPVNLGSEKNGPLPDNIVVLSDSAVEYSEVATGQNMDNVKTQLPCEPSEIPNTDIASETVRKAEEHEKQLSKQQVGNYQRCGSKSQYVHLT